MLLAANSLHLFQQCCKLSISTEGPCSKNSLIKLRVICSTQLKYYFIPTMGDLDLSKFLFSNSCKSCQIDVVWLSEEFSYSEHNFAIFKQAPLNSVRSCSIHLAADEI